ncbi:MAG: CDGSH iron-sulfur domain-containing protein [Vicinamibacterales bacterium]
MPEVEIQVRTNGPYRIKGPVKLIDVEGNEFELPGEIFTLCRCGHSATKPFCDASHRQAGFQADNRAGAVASLQDQSA